VRTTAAVPAEKPTRLVLVRHGEAACNVDGVVGGAKGCTGLTLTGRLQVDLLAERLTRTGEFGAVDALYSSTLPRALETATILAPALNAWREGPPLEIVAEVDLSELHPGQADGLTWTRYVDRYPALDWDVDPSQPFSPGGESWTGFIERAAGALTRLAVSHLGETVVVACHAGVIESSLLRFLPVDPSVLRLRLRTLHASLTVWEYASARWMLQRYNDVG
jgi:probable phosphoglycerate mutase